MSPHTRVLPLRQAGDWWVLEIRGARDIPGYDPEKVGRGMGSQMYRREVLGDWSATIGRLVYPEFGPVHQSADPLPYDPTLPLVLGWDFGGSPWSGTPAVVITQVSPYRQWFIYECIIPPKTETVGIYEFTRELAGHLEEHYAHPYGLTLDDLLLRHYGDPAGNNRPPTTMASSKTAELRSCYEVIRDGTSIEVGSDEYGDPVYETKPGWGWVIESGEPTLTKRMSAVRDRLTTITGGHPALLVDPGATYILDAFLGGYHYHQRADGRFELDPQKNWHSHGMNALEYAASRLGWAMAPDDEPADYRHQYDTGTAVGAGRYGRNG